MRFITEQFALIYNSFSPVITKKVLHGELIRSIIFDQFSTKLNLRTENSDLKYLEVTKTEAEGWGCFLNYDHDTFSFNRREEERLNRK